MRLTGYLFWDGARWCAENPGRGCDRRADVVASLWGLHPVWRVEVEGGAVAGARSTGATGTGVEAAGAPWVGGLKLGAMKSGASSEAAPKAT